MTAGSKTSLLLITTSYPPVIGGSEIEAQRVCGALHRGGHRVGIICPGGEPMPPESSWVDPYGVPVKMYGGGWPGAWRYRVFAAGAAWSLLRRTRQYEVAYFLMPGLQVITGMSVAWLLRKPVVMKFSGSNEIRKLGASWLGRLQRALVRKIAGRILVLNDGLKQEAAEAGFDAERLRWMPNPVDADEFAPCAPELRPELRKQLGLPIDGPLVVFVGRLAPEKELGSLIRAFSQVQREYPEAALALVGDGAGRKELEAEASRLGLREHVRFVGMTDMAGVLRWLHAADAFALVSSLEGFPCSLIEAMSAGLPSVVSDIPAMRQLVEHDATGLVAGLRDESSIAGNLSLLLGDAELRQRLGQAAREHVTARYSIRQVTAQYASLLSELVHGRSD